MEIKKRNGKDHISMYLVTVEDEILTTLEVNVLLITLLVLLTPNRVRYEQIQVKLT